MVVRRGKDDGRLRRSIPSSVIKDLLFPQKHIKLIATCFSPPPHPSHSHTSSSLQIQDTTKKPIKMPFGFFFCLSPRFHLLIPFLSSILLIRPGAPEKTLCERKLAEIPANVFYYQRTEAATAIECAERCIEDWEYCKSAVLVQEKVQKNKIRYYCSLSAGREKG